MGAARAFLPWGVLVLAVRGSEGRAGPVVFSFIFYFWGVTGRVGELFTPIWRGAVIIFCMLGLKKRARKEVCAI